MPALRAFLIPILWGIVVSSVFIAGAWLLAPQPSTRVLPQHVSSFAEPS